MDKLPFPLWWFGVGGSFLVAVIGVSCFVCRLCCKELCLEFCQKPRNNPSPGFQRFNNTPTIHNNAPLNNTPFSTQLNPLPPPSPSDGRIPFPTDFNTIAEYRQYMEELAATEAARTSLQNQILAPNRPQNEDPCEVDSTILTIEILSNPD